MPDARVPAVVCVPARDEAERLPRLLRSLNAQEGLGAGDPLRVVIVANNCFDGTADVARWTGGLTALDLHVVEATFEEGEAHVGSARRLALDVGAAWLAASGGDGMLLTTDADARVPADWLAANSDALADAEIVGGRLVVDPDVPRDRAVLDLHARIEAYWSAVRALEDRLDPPPHDPAPRHGDHTGASLALRASLYRAVGGLPALARGEDNALVARVREHGGRLRHCPRVRVRVSDRIAGRAEGGMAHEMVRRASVANGHGTYRLPAPSHWNALIGRRAALRRAWCAWIGGTDATVAFAATGLDRSDLAAIDPESCRNDIAFVERAARALEARAEDPPLIALDAALVAFAELLGRPRVDVHEGPP